MINNIYSLRKNFILVGLTGRTGSGCTSVADLLTSVNFSDLKSKYQEFREGEITNQTRKDRIVYNFLKGNWFPFIKITASDIIFYFAALESEERLIQSITKTIVIPDPSKNGKGVDEDLEERRGKKEEELKKYFERNKGEIERLRKEIADVEEFIQGKRYRNENEDGIIEQIDEKLGIIFNKLPSYRKIIEEGINTCQKGIVPHVLQEWGNNIRKYKSIAIGEENSDAHSAIARKINQIIKCIRRSNEAKSGPNGNMVPTRIVIDALRNPFEILYFRERYSAFYCMSVSTTERIRHENLLKNKGFRMDEIIDMDNREGEKKSLNESYQEIDVIRCIELSDIFLSHNGEEPRENRDLINQLVTYISLIMHPGIIPPTPQERIMQVAFTAKLNSGCLSRQVGAAITDENFSVKAIGWNSVPEGQVPCSLRHLDDLVRGEDSEAFSFYETTDDRFSKAASRLRSAYDEEKIRNLKGVHLTYCFKNIHTNMNEKQRNNQVHTRSLHAEENAFLQLSKYGSEGIKGGKLFTTASCCELCAKKAYHLGIKDIYYIDSYPGISYLHIFQSGRKESRPEVHLFSGAIGRAYINLYSPFVALKDEIEYLTDVNVKKVVEGGNPVDKNK